MRSKLISIMFETDATFLAGKVLKRSLPVVSAGGDRGASRVKRLMLPQGELAHFYDGEQGMRYIAFIALQAGTIRGNHYHKMKQEFIYLIEGELLLILEDIASKCRESLLLRAGDLALISPNIAHALHPRQTGQAVEYSPERFDPADIYPYPLV